MQAIEIMKTHVVKTMPDSTLAEAIDLMDLYQVRELPVVDTSNRLLGILTEQDVWEVVRNVMVSDAPISPTKAALIAKTLVSDVMTNDVISANAEEEVSIALQKLLQQGVKRLPVTSQDGTLVGTLNRVDIIQAIFDQTLLIDSQRGN